MRNVHCQDNKRRFRLSGLSQVGHDQIQTIATLADPIAALYHIAITAVLIGLSVVFVSSILLSSPEKPNPQGWRSNLPPFRGDERKTIDESIISGY